MEASGSTSQSKKKKNVRGQYYGAIIEKELALLRTKGITRLEVEFEPATGKAIKKYGKWFNNHLAYLVRDTLSPAYFRWEDVPQVEVQTVYVRLAEKFVFPLDNRSITDYMEARMQNYFSAWRGDMRKHWVNVGGETNNEVAKTCPPQNVSPSDWTKLCEYWASNSQQAISQRNKRNRAKMTMLGGHGSKSIVAHAYDDVDESGRLRSMIDTFEAIHRNERGWLSEEAMKAHQEMTQRRRSSQSMHATSSGASCVGGDDAELAPDLNIVTGILGTRSRYKKGYGSLPRLKAFGKMQARTSGSKCTNQHHVEVETILDENKKLKQDLASYREYLTVQSNHMTAQHQYMTLQCDYIMNMMDMMQEMQSFIPGGLIMAQHMPPLPPPPCPPSPPPPSIFADAASSQPSHSVHQDDDNDDDTGRIPSS